MPMHMNAPNITAYKYMSGMREHKHDFVTNYGPHVKSPNGAGMCRDDESMTNMDGIMGNATWRRYMQHLGHDPGVGDDVAWQELMHVCQGVCLDAMPRWVMDRLEGHDAWLDYLCTWSLPIKEGDLKGSPMCFPIYWRGVRAKKENRRHTYVWTTSGSYLKVDLGAVKVEGKDKPTNMIMGVHELLCYLMHGPRGKDKEVVHVCEHKWCINPHHLRWKSHAENMAYSWQRSPYNPQRVMIGRPKRTPMSFAYPIEHH